MKINIVCFSQTGNTHKVGRAMTGDFNDKGHEADYIPFKKAAFEHLTGADIIGIGAPCFESQAPTPVREFLSESPRLTGKKAFVFATSGGCPGRVRCGYARGYHLFHL